MYNVVNNQNKHTYLLLINRVHQLYQQEIALLFVSYFAFLVYILYDFMV